MIQLELGSGLPTNTYSSTTKQIFIREYQHFFAQKLDHQLSAEKNALQ